MLLGNNTAQLSLPPPPPPPPAAALPGTFTAPAASILPRAATCAFHPSQCEAEYAVAATHMRYNASVPLLLTHGNPPVVMFEHVLLLLPLLPCCYNTAVPLVLSNGNQPLVMSHHVLLLLLLLPLTCCCALLRYYHPHPPQRAVKSERTFEGISLDTPGQSSRQVLQMSRFQLCSTCYQRESSPPSGMLLLLLHHMTA